MQTPAGSKRSRREKRTIISWWGRFQRGRWWGKVGKEEEIVDEGEKYDMRSTLGEVTPVILLQSEKFKTFQCVGRLANANLVERDKVIIRYG